MMRITAYADRLIDDLDRSTGPTGQDHAAQLDRAQQGARVAVRLAGRRPITVFTTRPDTLFGATVHGAGARTSAGRRADARAWPDDTDRAWTDRCRHAEAVAAYRKAIAAKTDLERQENRRRPACSPGATRSTRSTGEPMPIWIADYVLMGYGTGAIMAVPCGDQRDFEFADGVRAADPRLIQRRAERRRDTSSRAETLPWPRYVGDVHTGRTSRSTSTAWTSPTAKATIDAWLEADGHGEAPITYKLRDWLFSRQRYWGEPFPIVYDERRHAASRLPDSELPVELPETDDFSPRTFDPTTTSPTRRARSTGWRLGRASNSIWATARSTTAATPT